MKPVTSLLSQLRPGEDEDPLLMVLDPPKAQAVGNFSVQLEGVWNPALSRGDRAGSQGEGAGSGWPETGSCVCLPCVFYPGTVLALGSSAGQKVFSLWKQGAALCHKLPTKVGSDRGEDVTLSHRTRVHRSHGSASWLTISQP